MLSFSSSAAGALLLNALIWGLSWIGFKSLQVQGMHPLWATAFIFTCCTAVMVLARPGAWREMWRHPELLYVALATGLTNVCFNIAMAFGDVVRVVLLFYLMPVWAVLLARLILNEAITPRALARIALGLGGAMIVLYRPELGLPLPRSGADWVAILGGLSFAFTNVMLRRLRGVPDGARAIAMFGGAALLAGVLAGVLLMLGWVVSLPAHFDAHIVSTLALWTVLLLISNMCLQYGAARLPVNIIAVIMLSEILVSALSSWWMGATHLGWQDMVGGLLIVAAPWVVRDLPTGKTLPS
ncbi:DMT family transporter [Herbaspirillum sp. RTI4]|uniref:DMT family transporter n=1 Tax=Herbaspirillum sp. RTI4 TaxID=3048640 RepID=UPI002AB3E657|nr:DMT family transporter [Herbaspirillum sp. RTI4]MDY7577718.1 DMT family transporter [Herbaspirillum sp. RTI4]MEA9980854.1 DMT family transporter [Herbaspirillum sp. RTI4]